MKKAITLIFIVLIFYSCTNDFMTDAMRPDKLPDITKPTVYSFKIENKIEIKWDADDVDEYILYRDTKPTGTFSSYVYKGTDTSYIDSNVINDAFYYYKLAKKQGKKEFSKSDYSVGACKDIKKDACEDNDTKDTAIELTEISTNANIYFYKDSASSTAIEDRDWYKITLEPMTRFILGFHKVNEGGFDNGDLLFNIEYGTPEEIQDYENSLQQTYLIENKSYVTKTIYFQVTINKTKLIPDIYGSYTRFGSYILVSHGTETIH